MKLDSIKNYSPSANHKLKRKNVAMLESGNESGIETEKNVNRGYYGGSFTGTNPNAALKLNGITDKLFQTNIFEKGLDFAFSKAAVTLAFVSLIVAGVLRPITNLSMAGKDDREDSIYAASHAIASAGIGFLVSSAVMKPFDDGLKKFSNNIKENLKGLEGLFGVDKISSRKLAKSKPYQILRKIASMGIDTVLLGIPKALLTIALIPPILKYVFHMEKGKHHNKQEEVKVDNNNNQPQVSFAKNKRPSMKDLLGGNK